jgi:hypothetical protein
MTMGRHFYHGTSRPLVHLYETIISPSNKNLRYTNNTREALGKMVSTCHTPHPQTLSPLTLPPVITITRTTTCLDLNLPERQVMCQKCLKVLLSTPDYDCTNPAHRRWRRSHVDSSFKCEKPWDTLQYLQKGVRQGQAHQCLLANEYLRSIGLVAQERVADAGTPSEMVVDSTPITSIAPATASADALQPSTMDREQVEPLRSLWDHSAPTPASPTPFVDHDTTGVNKPVAIDKVATPCLLTSHRPCQGWTGDQYDHLFQISCQEHVLPRVKTTNAKSAAEATFGLARRFLKHGNAHQLCFKLENDKFVLRHEENCLGQAIRKLCNWCL